MEGESFLIVSVPFGSEMFRVWVTLLDRLRISLDGKLLLAAGRSSSYKQTIQIQKEAILTF